MGRFISTALTLSVLIALGCKTSGETRKRNSGGNQAATALETACTNSEGTWTNNLCTCPTGKTLSATGQCIDRSDNNETEEEQNKRLEFERNERQRNDECEGDYRYGTYPYEGKCDEQQGEGPKFATASEGCEKTAGQWLPDRVPNCTCQPNAKWVPEIYSCECLAEYTNREVNRCDPPHGGLVKQQCPGQTSSDGSCVSPDGKTMILNGVLQWVLEKVGGSFSATGGVEPHPVLPKEEDTYRELD